MAGLTDGYENGRINLEDIINRKLNMLEKLPTPCPSLKFSRIEEYFSMAA
jgi:hypothetical protein